MYVMVNLDDVFSGRSMKSDSLVIMSVLKDVTLINSLSSLQYLYLHQSDFKTFFNYLMHKETYFKKKLKLIFK